MRDIRQKRTPINCEPCRIRKIRCPRDGVPCGTCKRRGVPAADCSFAQRPARNLQSTSGPIMPISPISTSRSPKQTADEDLVARIARIERMLAAQQPNTQDASSSILPHSGSRVSTSPLTTDTSAGGHGALQTSASGHVRFVPCWPTTEPDDESCPDRFESDISPFGTQYMTSGLRRSDILALLPPTSLCTRLKDIYFESFSPLFHVLHDPTFHQQYIQFEHDPESVSLAWLALLFAIISTSLSACDARSEFLSDLSRRPTVTAKIRDLSERYRAGAMRCLEMDNYLWRHNITTLQALIILIYGINHSHGQSWTLLGSTYHMALSLGCHIDPSSFKLNLVECEERRRCWACVMMLCTLQNTSMRNLAPHYNSSHYSVRMPADVNDFDLTVESTSLPIHTGRATQMSYLLLKFRLYDIGSRICSEVLNPPVIDPNIIVELDRALIQERDLWNSIYLYHSRQDELSSYHKIHLKILHSFSHQLALLLHRRVLMQGSADPVQHQHARSRSTESARALLDIHSSLHNNPEFGPFQWYNRGLGCFHTFHAAVVLIATISEASEPDSGWSDNIRLLRECVRRFEDLADLSLVCQRAAPILHRLLTGLGISISTDGSALPIPSGASASASTDLLNAGGEYEMGSLDQIFDHLNPQQWLTPSAVSWSHWDLPMDATYGS
ncbi:hypothetical protein D6C84_05683 [Aureobasidium pullulans]|uniref:Zn(2)-C6 fungal-type domain-containing protein n=1 Tax=Aureobasidium pullulans TaxID=5580 RepID=A0A4S9XRD2_AURPU|nr:hypothetical protein D6C84_05683 [Aureobasidium pullulans]